MKPFYILVALPAILLSNSANAQHKTVNKDREVTIGFGYEAAFPGGGMSKGMHSLHSLKMHTNFSLKNVCPNLEGGFELGYGIYGMKTYEVNYNFGGNYINTDVTYNSSVVQAGAHLNYVLLRETRIRPYLALKGGYARFYSSFQVEDPNDPAACKVVERKSITGDGAIYWGFGAGLRYQLKSRCGFESFVDFSVQKMNGGKVEYVNVNRLHQQNEPYQTTQGGKPVNFSFVNASTQHVHEHTIAELYNDPVRLLQFRVSYVTTFRL